MSKPKCNLVNTKWFIQFLVPYQRKKCKNMLAILIFINLIFLNFELGASNHQINISLLLLEPVLYKSLWITKLFITHHWIKEIVYNNSSNTSRLGRDIGWERTPKPMYVLLTGLIMESNRMRDISSCLDSVCLQNYPSL